MEIKINTHLFTTRNFIKQKTGKAKKNCHCTTKIKEKPYTADRMLSLFPEDKIHQNYRYSAYITNQEQSTTDLWKPIEIEAMQRIESSN